MEVFEIKKEKDIIACTHYLKSKLSKEAHGFKFSGQRVDEILEALGKRSILSYKRLKGNDLQINYLGGKLYIRNAGNVLNTKAFKGISKQLDKKEKGYSEKKAASLMKNHLEWRNNLKRKANRPKSVYNYNKKATFSKKEQYSLRFDGNTPICTISGTSRLTKIEYSYTYDGQAASKTIKCLSERKLQDFQFQKDGSMELNTSKGKIIINDYAHSKNGPGMSKLKQNMEKSANKMSQKEYNRRIKPINKKTAFLNKSKSLLNTGKKIVVTTAVGAALIYGANESDVLKQSYGYVVDTIAPIVEQININGPEVPDLVNLRSTSENTRSVELSYEERTDSEKYQHVVDNYSSIINKYANMYGLDPDLVIAIATHENGFNTNSDNMAAAGLMQIEKSVWGNTNITAYNHIDGKMEEFFLSKNKMDDVETNIKSGCMILERSIRSNNYDIVRGVAGYNMGGGNMEKIYQEAMKQTGKSREQVIEDYTWLDYTYAPGVGDKNYINHVFSYLKEGKDSIYVIDKDGVRHDLSVTNNFERAKTR